MKSVLVFDKGGRKERLDLIKKNKAPKDFFQGLDSVDKTKFRILHLSSAQKYKKTIFSSFFWFVEQCFSKVSNIGIRPLSVFQHKKLINNADYVLSLTDGFSLSLGFYYAFINKKSKIKLVGAFHRLSDHETKLSQFWKLIYFFVFKKILKRLDLIVFYGPADRINSIKNYKLNKKKTYIIKFGVDTEFWKPNKETSFNSNYLFSIGQDPARDFETLLKVKADKKIHIHTSLLKKKEDKHLKITNGSYNKYKNSYTDIEIRKLYQDAFAVIVPLKDVYQPSGYSVTLQAMSCGKPVILTLTKGLWAPTLFKNFENCILVKPKAIKEIEYAINLLQTDYEIYERISKKARLTAEKHFSLDIANKSTKDLFENFV